MKIPFFKYEGCGNDFIMITDPILCAWSESERGALCQAVCDRHFGIGADGCIFIGQDPLEMIYHNQDGTRADMCGNGIRCLAACALDEGLVQKERFDVLTRAGLRTIQALPGQERLFEVRMGKPDFAPEKIFASSHDPVINYPLQLKKGALPVTSFYMNTIHTVIFTEQDPFDPALEKTGHAVCHHPFFGQQTNVNFVQVLDPGHLKAATYERGCGMTLACGTGMCAAAVAARQAGYCEARTMVETKGGQLRITIEPDGSVLLCGPARRIAKGEFNYQRPALTRPAAGKTV